MLALSIRQPYAELILRGIKTAEYRSRSTRIVGRRFYIYASKGTGNRGQGTGKAWSKDLAMPDEKLPAWMIELAEQVGMIQPGELEGLPRGVIVGSAIIEKCTPLPVLNPEPRTLNPRYAWHLADVQRVKKFRKPKGHPQPVWFTPF
jgi:hypothetical protein